MTPPAFRKLLIVTVLAAVVALFSVFGRFDPATVEKAGVLMFPDLSDHVNEVTEIHVRDGKGTLTVRRGEKGWALDNKAGYPARDDRVRTAIIGLSELALSEPKTRLPERYADLQVEDVEADESKSVELSCATRMAAIWQTSSSAAANSAIPTLPKVVFTCVGPARRSHGSPPVNSARAPIPFTG